MVTLAVPVRLAAGTIAEQAALPINLDADSSEFDRGKERLVFRGLRIKQGTLAIQADLGEATKLDFDDSRWVFTGHVVVDNGVAKAYCDNAELTFTGHRLRNAVLNGEPARFEQQRPDKQLTRGRANTLDYDFDLALIRLSGDAWLSDGANEVSGDHMSYDLKKEFVLADADKGRQVRMRINPPARDRTSGKTP
jgi:lipopolysaccharide export system protein LptA